MDKNQWMDKSAFSQKRKFAPQGVTVTVHCSKKRKKGKEEKRGQKGKENKEKKLFFRFASHSLKVEYDDERERDDEGDDG